MQKKVIIVSILFFALSASFCMIHILRAQDATPTPNQTQNDLQNQIHDYQNKLTEIGNTKKTLSSQIQYMDTQIALINLQIEDSTRKITQLEKEIDILANRTQDLDSSVNILTKTMLQRVVASYKAKEAGLWEILLQSNNIDEFLNSYKYYKTAQEHNQKLLVEVQSAKKNYEEQKTLREQKKKELDNLKAQLNAQNDQLAQQKVAKQRLLEATQSSEAVYQNLLAKAQKELAGYSAFTQSQGGGLRSFGPGSNGWYYSQRDPSWGGLNIGSSPYKVWQAGCALTSVAMVCKSYGQNLSPAMMALDVSKYIYGDLINNQFNCSGKSAHFLGSSQDAVKDYVQKGTPVILRLYAPSVSGLHFIVVWKWDGSDFIMHDPYNGPDLKFSSLYSWSQVTNAIAIN